MRFIVFDADADLNAPLGGKARALAALRQAELPIPPWFVVLPDAFHASLSPEQANALNSAPDTASLRAVVDSVTPAAPVIEEIHEAVTALCQPGDFIAVRSSASDEDGAQHSFAGQLDSFLFVRPEEVANKVAAV